MASTAKAEGQDENVDPPFLEVADKVVHGDLGHQDEVPEPHRRVERHHGSWKSPFSVHKHKHNCPTVTQVCTQWTALVAVPPGLEPWQLLGRVVAAAVLQPAPSHWRAAHRRCCFNRHDPAPLNIYINVLILAVLILKIILDISKMILISFSLLHEDRKGEENQCNFNYPMSYICVVIITIMIVTIMISQHDHSLSRTSLS